MIFEFVFSIVQFCNGIVFCQFWCVCVCVFCVYTNLGKCCFYSINSNQNKKNPMQIKLLQVNAICGSYLNAISVR